ncbi:MAG: alpha/beta hydrolase [Candidatus Lokiarchaeota archaeon]|nr:alpha/beta hydrolase [Candidatus Harpocratesius repetitus]
MIIRPKHYLLLFLGIILASGIFYVNYFIFYGNSLGNSLYLSVFTFLFWWLCWSLYFEIRDFWQFRWFGADVERNRVEITPISIPLTSFEGNESQKNNKDKKKKIKFLHGEWIHSQFNSNKSPIIIFVHGFSDDSLYIRHYTIPLAHAGFNVIAYDNRGTKKSRKAGAKSQFVEITNDLEYVIKFLKKDPRFCDLTINLIGLSLGAIAVIKQGLRNLNLIPESQDNIKNQNDSKNIDKEVKKENQIENHYYINNDISKIIAVAAMGNYRESIPFSPVPFLKNWWFWLRYTFFGVPINPIYKKNFELSPLLQIERKKQEMKNQVFWKNYNNKKFYLIHAKNDLVIPVEHFWDNLDELNLDSSNWLITQRGGHNFLRYEPILLSQIIWFLHS